MKLSQAQTAEILLRTAKERFEAGDLRSSEEFCRALLNFFPNDPSGWLLLGDLALSVGKNREAIGPLERARSLLPDDAAVAKKLGSTYCRCGLYIKAEALYVDALKSSPGDSEVLEDYGSLCMDQGRMVQAEKLFRDAVKSRPEGLEGNAIFRLGRLLQARGAFEEAEASYRRVLEIAPDFLPGHNNLSNTLKGVGRLAEAEHHIRRALELDPSFALGYNNLGAILSDEGRPRESLEAYRNALRIEPNHPMANPNYLLAMHYGNDLSPAEIWDAHHAWNERVAKPLTASALPFPSGRVSNAPLRVGFVSPDLRHHPVGIFLVALIEAVDQGSIETVAYSTNNIEDETTGRLRSAFADWRNIANLDDESAAHRIRGDDLDILVDLSGHSAGGRMLLFARKPAPTQLTWLGYPDTSGLEAMDYRLTDVLADPPGAERFHSEKLVRMPDGFLCFNPPSEAPAPLGLPVASAAGGPTFGCFNNFAKITPEMLAVWARILHRLPAARLMIKNNGLQCPGLRDRLHQEFRRLEVEPDRVLLVPRVASYMDHLDLYNQVDVALDTSPYNGTTTTCEAMWMGVPVVTLRGDRHSARVGASLLSRVGLDRYVAETAEEYVDRAVSLAADTDLLANLRKTLRETMRGVPLGNPQMFARSFEETLLKLPAA